MTKLDRLARSLRDAKDMVGDLTRREVKLSIGGSVHDRLTRGGPARFSGGLLARSAAGSIPGTTYPVGGAQLVEKCRESGGPFQVDHVSLSGELVHFCRGDRR